MEITSLLRCQVKALNLRKHSFTLPTSFYILITTDLAIAKQALIADEIIAIPTETVYGLAGNAYSETAIKKIFTLKKRPFYNPLIVHIKSAAFLPQVACDIPAIAEKFEMSNFSEQIKNNEVIKVDETKIDIDAIKEKVKAKCTYSTCS